MPQPSGNIRRQLRNHYDTYTQCCGRRVDGEKCSIYKDIYIENVFQDAAESREQCHQEERSAIRQCTYKSLNDGRDHGEIMVSISFAH